MVLLLPSFLDLKFRLKLVKIAASKINDCKTISVVYYNRTIFILRIVTPFPLELNVKSWNSMVVGLLTCPMQGPQAFARTTAPTSCNTDVTLSRSIVARICSDPGVHRKGT
jgi:hypothetical protein